MKERKKDWVLIAFFMLSPILGVLGTALYSWNSGSSGGSRSSSWSSTRWSALSVTAGYHRLFSHRSYECHPAVQAFYLFFGAMALQNSILAWASDHRIHHRYVDHDWDPVQHPARRPVGAHPLDLLQGAPDTVRGSARSPEEPPGAVAAQAAEPVGIVARPRHSDARSAGPSAIRSAACSGAASCASSSSTTRPSS